MSQTHPPLYWLVSLPVIADAQNTRGKVSTAVGANAKVHDFRIPVLKVGTLDQLMALSDDLAKHDNLFSGIVKKLQRAYDDLVANPPKQPGGENKPIKTKELKIESRFTPTEYVEKFCWSPNKEVDTLPAFVKDLVNMTSQADDEVKEFLQKYNDIRTTLEALERKQSGNLLQKSLHEFVKESDVIESEYLTTLFVVVPKDKKKDFEQTYWQMEAIDKQKRAEVKAEKAKAMADNQGGEMVNEEDEEEEVKEVCEEEARAARLPQCDSIVPGSAKELAQDEEFVLFKINALKKSPRNMDYVKGLLRSERYTVRPFKFDADEEKRQEAEQQQLISSRFEKWTYLTKFVRVNYSTVFANFVHLKAVRAFVEGVLRYGLASGPPNYFYCLVQPKKGKDSQARTALNSTFASLGALDNGGSAEDTEALNSQFGEFFPYVSVTVDLTIEED